MRVEKTIREIFWDELNKTDFYLARQHHKDNINNALEKAIEFIVREI